jgi:predicted porin
MKLMKANKTPRNAVDQRTYVKISLILGVAILAFFPTARADELSDIQAQAKQLRDQTAAINKQVREQNAAITKRLADLEKRQKTLEAQKPVAINPIDAMAADLPYKAAVRAKPPENDDICVHGICLYGNFDMGLIYQNHAAPLNAFNVGPLSTVVEKPSNGSYFGVGANMMSTSFIGLRGKQEIADNLYAVFNLQTLFDPASGMNANQVGGIVQNNGLGANVQTLQLANAFGDSSKAGQMFNNAAYFGISSPTYGTFTMGRQSALSSDLVVNDDALSNATAFSVIAYEGFAGGGGDTENRIFDNAYEYRLNVGPVRLAAEAQLRNGGNSATGNAFEGNIGFDYMGLSLDVVGGKITDAFGIALPLSAAQMQQVNASGMGCSLGCTAGIVSDNTFVQLGVRYAIGPWKFYGGYENIRYANPDSPLAPGAFQMGGYIIAFPTNNFYESTKTLQIFWAGVKYAVTPNVDVAGAYYGYRQGSFLTPSNNNAAGGFGNCSTAFSPGCSGSLDAVSLVVDWRFARHMDMYAGVMYTQKTGGLANGYILSATNLNNPATVNTLNKVSEYDPAIGLRYQF